MPIEDPEDPEPPKAPRARKVLSVEERDRAVSSLRKVRSLSRLGVRLLADLVDRCPVYGIDANQLLPVRSVLEVNPGQQAKKSDAIAAPLLAFVVIEGAAQASQRLAAGAPPPPHGDNTKGKKKKAKASKAFAPAGGPLLLPMGTYGRFDGGLAAFELGDLRLDPLEVNGVPQLFKLLVVTPEAALPCPEAIHKIIAAETVVQVKALLQALATPELILFDAQPAFDDVLRPMMHLLAASAAQRRNVALVEFGQKTEASIWDPKLPGFTSRKIGNHSEVELRKLLNPLLPGSIFVLRDEKHQMDIDALTFDRIVYLTGRVPRALPQRLRPRLRNDLFDDPKVDPDKQEPVLGGFVPTVAVPFHNPPPGQIPRRFDTLEVRHSKLGLGLNEPPRGLRPYRDSCVVAVNRGLLRKTWDTWLPQWEAGTQSEFLNTAVTAGALRAESAARWARALHWRRVGVALSGGGACAYRFIPVLERLRDKNVPVDVFAGLSGGALLGVFYALRGQDGLQEYTNLGAFIQAVMPLASWSTLPFELTTDYLVGGARVENLEVRMAAVTVALPDVGPPHGAVVVQGTLGEAARASGTLPPTYAPTEKNGTRYTDGGACTAVPARVARECGADVILSCNAIPGPDNCNPFPAQIYGPFLSWLLRRLPPWDRLIDFQSWRSFQWHQASKVFGLEADAYLEFPASEISTAEPALFILSHAIVAAARKQQADINRAVDELEKAWHEKG